MMWYGKKHLGNFVDGSKEVSLQHKQKNKLEKTMRCLNYA